MSDEENNKKAKTSFVKVPALPAGMTVNDETATMSFPAASAKNLHWAF